LIGPAPVAIGQSVEVTVKVVVTPTSSSVGFAHVQVATNEPTEAVSPSWSMAFGLPPIRLTVHMPVPEGPTVGIVTVRSQPAGLVLVTLYACVVPVCSKAFTVAVVVTLPGGELASRSALAIKPGGTSPPPVIDAAIPVTIE